MPDAKPRFRWLWRGVGFALLGGLVFVLGSINVPFLAPDEPAEVILLYIFSGIVFLAFVIYGLVLTRYLARLYTEHRRQVLGTKFKTKMVVGALALTLLPVVALFFLSYAMLNRTLAKWFPRPLEIVRDDAIFLMQHLLRQHEDRARELAQDVAQHPEIQRHLQERDPGALQQALTRLVEQGGLEWAAVLDARDQPTAVYRKTGSRASFLEKAPALLKPREAVAFTTSERVGDHHYALARVRVESPEGERLGGLVVAQPLSPEVMARVADIERQSEAYQALTQERKSYRWQALLILGLLSLLLLSAATWSALHLARQVTVPIEALAQATEEVSRGNFGHRVDVPARDELGTLVASFNQMTAQLGENRQRLERAFAELDQRRQWMEAILESTPAGVVTLDPERRILDVNVAALRLLSQQAKPGSPLAGCLEADSANALGELFARADQAGFSTGPLDLPLPQRTAHLAVSVSCLRHGTRNEGYVLVLDDLSDLLKAQKAAAWQEVAQRIAHEIKNPLTPIQLSADRIRRYLERERGPEAGLTPRTRDLIAQCASLIAQEVHSLKVLVDEFSQFARFPAAQPSAVQLNDLVRDTLALYAPPANGLQLSAELAAGLPLVHADPALLRRVLVNLVDNAADAVAHSPSKQVQVRTRYKEQSDSVELSVTDTGVGIAPEHKDRLFLPFFSTKTSGSGLGLAIVSRIVAEHQGTVRVEDNAPEGTRVVVELPTRQPVVA